MSDKELRTYVVSFRYMTTDPRLDPGSFDFGALLDLGPGECIQEVTSREVPTTETDKIAFAEDQADLWDDEEESPNA